MRTRHEEWRLPQPGETLAEYVRAARRSRSLSQDDIVRRTDLSLATIRKIERGTTRNPGLFTLRQIWQVLELPTEALGRLPAPGTAPE